MRRRDFIVVLGGAAVWPISARAQQPGRPRRVGVLSGTAETDPDSLAGIAAFRQALAQRGWSEGRNILLEYRWGAGEVDRLRAHAKDLVDPAPDLIVAETTPAVSVMRRLAPMMPIVFLQAGNPVASGFVANLAHPGGNITGFTNFEPSMGGKWLELLKEIAPRVVRSAAIFNPETHTGQFWQVLEVSARTFGVEFKRIPVQDRVEIENALSGLALEPHGGLLVMPDSFLMTNRDLILALAARHSLPSIYPLRIYATNGGLLSYGNDRVDTYRRAAVYVDRILRGEKPSDLPVQAPTKFELTINLKTAKTLGLTVPQTLLARADEVIE
jgi:putative tryptophan/tyrosine transport system substrate-binding protein